VELRTGREPNQRLYLLVVADGLGGHLAGEVASGIAVQTLQEHFTAWDGGSPDRFVADAVQRANLNVYDAAHASPDHFNMQTTISAVALAGDRLTVAHVGDCRLYRLRDGRLDILTRDHTMAMEMLRLRMISPEQAAEHPGRYQLTRSLGASPLLHVDTVREKVMAGDAYLLCSDGLWGEVATDEIARALGEQPPQEACQELLSLVLDRGAPDNVTGITFRVAQATAAPAPGSRWRSLLRWGSH
jgi:protein phosphatase